MKRYVLAIMTVLFLSMLNLYAIYANEDDKYYKILQDAPDYFTKEYQEEIRKTNNDIDMYIEEKYLYEQLSDVSIKSGGAKYLNVPVYQQTNGYYCGPASAQMVLKYVQGTQYSQSSLAASMDTNSSIGTYVYKLTNTINNRLGSTQYEYIKNSDYAFGNSLVYNIDKDKPIVCHVKTHALPNYEPNYSVGHYIVATGYSWYASGSSGYSYVTYNDPHWNLSYFGTYTCTITEMTSAINANAGFYIRSK